jgi:hypothetical protein
MLHAQKELMALPSLDVISKVVKIHVNSQAVIRQRSATIWSSTAFFQQK